MAPDPVEVVLEELVEPLEPEELVLELDEVVEPLELEELALELPDALEPLEEAEALLVEEVLELDAVAVDAEEVTPVVVVDGEELDADVGGEPPPVAPPEPAPGWPQLEPTRAQSTMPRQATDEEVRTPTRR